MSDRLNLADLKIQSPKELLSIAEELEIAVKEKGVVWNRTESPPEKASDLEGVETFGCVPSDEAVLEACMKGESIRALDAESPAYSAVCKILDEKLEN